MLLQMAGLHSFLRLDNIYTHTKNVIMHGDRRLTRLIMVISSQYIQILNHYAVYLKLIKCYMSITHTHTHAKKEHG